MISAYLCCSRVQLLVWKCFFYKQNWYWSGPCAVKSWQLWGSGGLGAGWGVLGEAWVLTGRNGGYWRSSAAEVGVGRVGSGAHYSGELPAATSGAPTSSLLKYLKQVLTVIVMGNMLSPKIFDTNPLLMANIWIKSSPPGEVKYLKEILSSWWNQISETNPLLMANIWKKSTPHGEVKYLK